MREFRIQLLKIKLDSFSSQHENWLKSVSPTARKFVGKCNPFFFRWLLEQANYDDVECGNILQHGAEVVGKLGGRESWLPVPPSPEAPPLSREEVINESERDRERFLSTIKSSAHDEAMWSTSLEDVDDGKMEGPFFSQEGVRKWLGTTKFCLNRRFPVGQGEKIRPMR